MPFSDVYRRQVQLLVRTLPLVAEQDCFALKGGTAINLFYRKLPRGEKQGRWTTINPGSHPTL
jgi:hypothetical protein